MADNLLEVDLLVAGATPEGRPRVAGRFVIPPGVTVLRGPSGAGKSSCLAAIAGLLRPTRGRITLGDRVLFDDNLGIDLPPERRRVGLVFQSLALFPHMTAARNVAYAVPRRLPAARRREQAATWLARMRVDHLAERRPSTLSGGEAQRVALARALAAEPQALLLDEPFSALDDALRHSLRRELFAVIRELALPTILVTHDASDLERELDTNGLERALPQLVLSEGRLEEGRGGDPRSVVAPTPQPD